MAWRRTIVITGDFDPVPVVFEMIGSTVVIQPGESLRLVTSGPEDADLTIGYGRDGISVSRDPRLVVQAYGTDGEPVDLTGFG